MLGRVDDWLGGLFGPDGIDATLSQLADQAAPAPRPRSTHPTGTGPRAHRRIRHRDQPVPGKPQGGVDPAVVGPWIAETQAKKVAAQAGIRAATWRRQMTPDDIAAIVAVLGDLTSVVQRADPADKAEIYSQLGLTLTYLPARQAAGEGRRQA